MTTAYLLDVATPLTMVLAEKVGTTITAMYWHGLDLLGQSDGTDEQYFQYDGLGSVRQLTGDAGAVGLAQTFDPYGNGYSKDGSAATSYGFTGEQTDGNGFVFLRARYYNPASGRFSQTDPSRMEKNPYLYAAGNPVMMVDPSGLWIADPASGSFDALDAYLTIQTLHDLYNINIDIDFGWYQDPSFSVSATSNGMPLPPVLFPYSPSAVAPSLCKWEGGNWTTENLHDILTAFDKLKIAIHDAGGVSFDKAQDVVKTMFGDTTIVPNPMEGTHAFWPHVVEVDDWYRQQHGIDFQYAILHEFGHVWDKRNGVLLSRQLSGIVGRQGYNCLGYTTTTCFTTGEHPPGWEEDPGQTTWGSKNNYAARGQMLYPATLDDFAESFASYVISDYWTSKSGAKPLLTNSRRWKFIHWELLCIAQGDSRCRDDLVPLIPL